MRVSRIHPHPRLAELPDDRPVHPEGASGRASTSIGVVLDQGVQEGWVLEALRQALLVKNVRLAAIALMRRPPRWGLVGGLHRLVDRVDMRLRCGRENLFEPVDVTSSFPEVPKVELHTEHRGSTWHFSDDSISALRDVGADVWLWLCDSAPPSPMPPISRAGVWGLEIGARVPAGSPWAGASEVSMRADLTFAQVVDYTQPGRNVVYQACGATIKNSARRNRLVALRKGISFFGRLLRSIQQNPSAANRLQATEPALPSGMRPDPTLRTVARLSWRLAAEVVANRWSAVLWREQWRIGYYFAKEEADAVSATAQLLPLVPPRDRDWADPFLVCHGGRNFIFFEELPYAAGRAHISAVEVHRDGSASAPFVVLERPYHLSYPFIFAWMGDLYMLPESAGNGTLELYRCEQFPDRWTLDRVLLQGIRAFDATLHREGQQWWMFVNVAEPGADPSEEMHIYWSDSPLGPWQPHPANPVVSDARHARGAGPLFRRNGLLYRPSQDCSATYGSAVAINRIDRLDTEGYLETPVGRIEPNFKSGMRCLHTIGSVGALRVMDFRVRRPVWSRR